MSWIGKMFGIITPKNEIEKYLDECAEYANSLEGRNKSNEFWKLIKQTHEYIENNKFDSNKKDNLGEPPISEEYANQKILEYFEKTPKEKVLEDWNACQLHILFSGKSFAGLDKRKVGEQMREMGILGVQKTDNIPPSPEKHKNLVTPNYEEMKYLEYIYGGIKERVPFENFKNNRKSMKKEVRHEETHVVTSVENEGVVTITIEPKKGFGLCKVGLDITTGEIQKERVLPKYLMNPKPELQDQYDTLAKLITTRDYYNAGSVFSNSDIVAVIIVDCVSQDIVGHGGDVRFGKTKSKLYFKNALTADIFLKNFRSEIESVKHLI